RHRYYRLAGAHVARLLETLSEQAPPQPVRSLREGTRANAIRRARYCYDHLAGQLGVGLMGSLLDRGVLSGGDGRFDPEHHPGDRLSAHGHDVDYRLTDEGERWLESFGVELDRFTRARRPLIRYCLDWSEQRHHLAGALGAAIAARLFELDWLRPHPRSRAVLITDRGRAGLREEFGLAPSERDASPLTLIGGGAGAATPPAGHTARRAGRA
ncbi:MAG TPA: hypothetical protein VE992_03100, partial [Solirubrobacteraceae bacterium]|nr:hypothetical protein [Solirubrobacteraceae bacterium]